MHAVDDGWYHNPDLRQDGGFGDGTAAKLDAARIGAKTSLVQRNIRMRRRLNKPPELVANMQSTKHKHAVEDLETSISNSHRPDLPALSVSSGFSGNNPTATITPMTDMSNYLPTPAASNEDMGCPSTTSDHQAFRYASPVEDMYGWDAELDRRESSPSRASMSSTDELDTIALSYRRANGSKHSLLQRVFRVGSSSSMAKIETAI